MGKPIATVIIPTHNRMEKLGKCLEALKNQNVNPSIYEVIVIDDGSTDQTEKLVRSFQKRSPFRLTYHQYDHEGPAKARNHGIESAKGEILLFTGDDIYLQPHTLKEHLSWHDQFPDPRVGVIGRVEWYDKHRISSAMKWLDRSGEQFNFRQITDQEEVDPVHYFYTSNVSLKRQFIIHTGEYFDERFLYAAYEDIELGCRLLKKGFRLKYNRDAVGFHDHYISTRNYVKKMVVNGKASVYFYEKVDLAPLKKEAHNPREPSIKRVSRQLPGTLKEFIIRRIYSPFRTVKYYSWHGVRIIWGFPFYVISLLRKKGHFSGFFFTHLGQFGRSLGVVLYHLQKTSNANGKV